MEHERGHATAGDDPERGRHLLQVGRAHVEVPQRVAALGPVGRDFVSPMRTAAGSRVMRARSWPRRRRWRFAVVRVRVSGARRTRPSGVSTPSPSSGTMARSVERWRPLRSVVLCFRAAMISQARPGSAADSLRGRPRSARRAGPALARLLDRGDEVARVAPEAVQLPRRERVAGLERLRAGQRARAGAVAIGGGVLVDALGLDAGGDRRVAPGGERLGAVALRDPHVADRRGPDRRQRPRPGCDLALMAATASPAVSGPMAAGSGEDRKNGRHPRASPAPRRAGGGGRMGHRGPRTDAPGR